MFDVLVRFKDGGPFMWVLLVVAAWVFAIALDRLYVLFIKSAINGRVVMGQIERYIKAGDIGSAIKYCTGLDSKPLVKVLKSALQNVDAGPDRMNSAMDETMLEVLPALQKRTSYLFTLGNIATLLGLLGTISGLIQSFGSLDVSDPSSQSKLLGSGIAIAMLTTAFGLMIAVPAILVHTLVQSRTEHIVEQIDHFSTKLVNMIDRLDEPKAKAS
jgi:biopolymer transport protein ExbB/TolQ